MTPFDARRLVGDLVVTLDADVLGGAYPDRDPPPEPAPRVLARHGITAGAVSSLRAALFDMTSGNDETLASATSAGVVPVGALDLRDPLGAAREMERLAALGVRAIRLFPDEQGVEAGFPSVRHIAKRAAALDLTVLTGGDVRRFWQPFTDLGLRVVFLDTHFYHLGDFLVAAAGEPGFHTSTRLLNSPDALETAVGEVGAERLLFGSRTPYYEPLVPLLRLATGGLKPDEVALVAGGNARRLLLGESA
ncbi:putative TIM-barrel fold metal-dependent hydrolase [Streptosporangium album]|uniref:Putative TIM-barrel fold metal-dependent hydrolase n=1 Tax=Streptosporangium album TaxID=47479 RepID=A0A7W7S2C5_9ACTN|nr:amidohydrolase family protein [Streptosporangium album]MBB4942610.1 putative TIM-barrel fold metal-dependent hydrolase [Streptosporangium album]